MSTRIVRSFNVLIVGAYQNDAIAPKKYQIKVLGSFAFCTSPL